LWKIDLKEPHQVYKNAAGTRLPGVTSVLGVLDKAALRGWYADMERRHVLSCVAAVAANPLLSLSELLGEKWAADVKKGRSADIGTVAHARCEAFLHGMVLDEEGLDPDLLRLSLNGFARFQDVWVREGLSIVHSELQMVSERRQVGGTADIIARRPDGGLELKDLKTSKASRGWPYPEVFAQVAAYAEMCEEVGVGHIDVVSVERIGKEDGDPGQSYVLTGEERAVGLKLFDAALAVYRAGRALYGIRNKGASGNPAGSGFGAAKLDPTPPTRIAEEAPW
jgi:hypothetical protein